MDGKEIFNEILKSPQLKELIGAPTTEEINEEYDKSSEHPVITVVQSIIEAQIQRTSEDALFKTLLKIFEL